MAILNKIKSNLLLAWKDYSIIWPQIIIFQIFARVLQSGFVTLLSLVGFKWLLGNSELSLTNFDLLQSINISKLVIVLFIGGLISLILFYFEYIGIIYIADKFYEGGKISLRRTLLKILLQSQRFVRMLLLQIAIIGASILFFGLSAFTIWTVLPHILSYFLVIPLTIFGIFYTWDTILKLVYANYHFFDKTESIFSLFTYKLNHRQHKEIWIFTILLVILTSTSVLLGGLVINSIIFIINLLTTNLTVVSALASLVISVSFVISTVVSFLFTGFLTLHRSRIYHKEFSKIIQHPISTHDYNYESRAVSIWKKNQIQIILISCGLVVSLIITQTNALKVNISKYLERDFITMAHRGGNKYAENTLETMQDTIQSNIDFIETDLQLTADGDVIIYHDKNLTKVKNTQEVTTLTTSELKKLKFETGENLITLDELLEISKDKVGLNLELKVYNSSLVKKFVEVLFEKLEKYRSSKSLIITSLNIDIINIIEKQYPQVITGLVVTAANNNLSNSETDWLMINDIFWDNNKNKFKNSKKKIALWSFDKNWTGIEAYENGLDAAITDSPQDLQEYDKDFKSLPIHSKINRAVLWSVGNN
jgi:glycerophosphoryl diester phosphodiesterase